MRKKLNDAENFQEEDNMNQENELPVYLHLIENIYGENTKFVCKLINVMFTPQNKSKGYDFGSIDQRSFTKVITNDKQSKSGHDTIKIIDNYSVSMNSISSTNSGKTLASELKLSLYDKKTPATIKYLLYTIWMLYAILIAASLTDWIIFYNRSNRSSEIFGFINIMTERLNRLSVVTMDCRTIDLIARDLEKSQCYGNSSYTEISNHVYSYIIIIDGEITRLII